MQNREIILKSRPTGWPDQSHFESRDCVAPEIGDGELLIRTIYLSVDPYMRARMNDVKSYIPSFQIGNVMDGGIVGQVIASNNADYAEGDYVMGQLPWALISKSDGKELHKVRPEVGKLSWYLGVLGMPGQTAWVGLNAVAGLKEGDNVFVSGASGAVGQVVGQIAKSKGCYVVGSAGGKAKCDYLKEIGFDATIDYKSDVSVYHAMAEACPNGIDVHFENVGGPIFEAALNQHNFGARVALCGWISSYNTDIKEMPAGPRNIANMIGRGVMMKGFIVFQYMQEALEWIPIGAKMLTDGTLRYEETVVEGLENAPQALIDMMQGKNLGKMIVKVADE